MRKLILPLFLLLITPLAGQWVSASPYDPRNVPAGAKWVIHIDVDAAQKTELGKSLRQHLEADAAFLQKARDFQTFTGTRLLEDVHSVLLFGREFEGPRSVLLIHAAVDKERLVSNMRLAKPDFSSQFYREKFEIVSWTDDNKKTYACFYQPTVTLVSQSFDEVAAALDTLDGKAPSLEPDSLLATRPGEGTILFLVSDKLKEMADALPNKPSPIARSADAGTITFGEVGSQLFLKGLLVSPSNDLAKQTRMALDGLRAIIVLSAKSNANAPADPFTQAIIDIVRDASVDVRDRIVNVEVRMNVATVLRLLPRELGGAGGEPAANPKDNPR